MENTFNCCYYTAKQQPPPPPPHPSRGIDTQVLKLNFFNNKKDKS
jgi:hypothetical protein